MSQVFIVRSNLNVLRRKRGGDCRMSSLKQYLIYLGEEGGKRLLLL